MPGPRIPIIVRAQGADPLPRGVPARSTVVRLEQTDDRQVNALQDNILAATAGVRASPMADGNLITGLAFTSGQARSVSHRLDRPWRGYFVTKTDQYVQVKTAAQPAGLDKLQLTLTANATCTVDLWVF